MKLRYTNASTAQKIEHATVSRIDELLPWNLDRSQTDTSKAA
jgi:hypothetical protein